MAEGTNIRLKRRILAVFIIFATVIVLLMSRVFFLQFVQGDELRRDAVEQQTRDRVITPKRGSITDRNGKELAVSASVETVSVAPNVIAQENKQEEVARKLSEILGLDYDTVYKKVTSNSYYTIIQKKVDKEVADQIRAEELPGVNLDEDSKRYYPLGDFASGVIGVTGADNQGLSGIELAFDEVLKGKPGRVVSAKNGDGSDMPFEYERYYDAEDGTNVVLTIDEVIQHYAEKYLEQAYIENKCANGAACIVMDPKTGDILAMAVEPGFDLNEPFTLTDPEQEASLEGLEGEEYNQKKSELIQRMWRNKAVSDSYEPGSTFKVITAAMALEENVVAENETFNCVGYLKVGGHTIHCDKTAGHGVQTFQQGFMNSCNPVFMTLGARVGAQNFYKYFKAFGFTEPTGIELNGETEGIFFDLDTFYNGTAELATSSFGQGFQVTPLQMVSAISAIANGGQLVKPRLVKALTDDEGNVVKNYEPEVVRQVISADTAKQIASFMEQNVASGGGRNAYIPGYKVGGKTGTSEKQPRGSGKRIASFIGIAPADDPQLVCLVILDEPTGDVRYGGVIAAPVFKNIVEDTLRYLGVQPKYTEDELQNMVVAVPDCVTQSVTKAKEFLSEANLKFKVIGDGDTVTDQTPKALAKISGNSTVILYTGDSKAQSTVTVPDVTKCSPVQVNSTIVSSGLNLQIVGDVSSGTGWESYAQDPPAGTVVEPGTVVTVEFRHMDGD